MFVACVRPIFQTAINSCAKDKQSRGEGNKF
jgi:hypothetical protein